MCDTPSPFEAMVRIRRVQQHRAIGEDLVPDELLKLCPQATHRLLYPLMLKAVLTVRPPLQWRGGQIMELYKGKGSASDPASYRDVCLAGVCAKVFGKCWRTRLATRLAGMTNAMQFGSGMHGGDTSTAHLALRSMMDIAEVQGETLDIVFVDVASAFPSLMRSPALDTVGGDEALLQRLKALGFDDTDIAAIRLDITSTPWMAGQVTARQAQMLGTLHSFTWATVDGTEGIIGTHRGAAAGLPLSDVIFIAALGRVVAKIEKRLEEEHLITDACFG